jgi:stearoyl-CoA desaturase (delta-9 desaturase)
MIQNQHDYWIVWAITAGIAFPLLVGYLTGSFWGAFFLGVCGRFFFIHQSVFLINSACHMFGKPTYDLNASARDSWVCAFLTHGEGFHSYHHRFPSDYRNGVRWYQWDPTKWTIRFLSWLGLASDLNRTPEVQIMAVRTEVEHQKLLMDLSKVKKPAFSQAIEHLNEFYLSHKSKLKTWEACAHEYQQLCRKMTHDSIEQLKQKTLQMEKAREDFFDSHREWLQLTRRLTYLLPT